MAFCMETTWDVLICNCENSQSEHVHCACNGMPVSRATAFRHRKREYCLSGYSSSSRATGNLNLHEEEIEEGQGHYFEVTESSSSEILHAVDQETFDCSDSPLNALDSGTPKENESNVHVHVDV